MIKSDCLIPQNPCLFFFFFFLTPLLSTCQPNQTFKHSLTNSSTINELTKMISKLRILQAIVAGLTYLVALLTKVVESQKGGPPQQKSAEESEREVNERFGLSWRVAVEANNVRRWRTVPPQCYHHLQNYMCAGQYERDLSLAVEHILLYASQIPLSPDGMDAWILDVDDTCISNVSYYKTKRFGYVTHCLLFFHLHH